MRIMNVVRIGDNVNTDDIISGRYLRAASTDTWRDHLFEDYDPSLLARLGRDALLVAGSNFGCGSSREQAVLGLKAAGIGVVLAASYGSIFQRNCVNNGVLAATYTALKVALPADGAAAILDLHACQVRFKGSAPPLVWEAPALHREICLAGGLLAYFMATSNQPRTS